MGNAMPESLWLNPSIKHGYFGALKRNRFQNGNLGTHDAFFKALALRPPEPTKEALLRPEMSPNFAKDGGDNS